MNPTITALQWVSVAIEGGLLLALIKGLLYIGQMLQLIKDMKETQNDHGDRISSLEQHLIGVHK